MMVPPIVPKALTDLMNMCSVGVRYELNKDGKYYNLNKISCKEIGYDVLRVIGYIFLSFVFVPALIAMTILLENFKKKVFNFNYVTTEATAADRAAADATTDATTDATGAGGPLEPIEEEEVEHSNSDSDSDSDSDSTIDADDEAERQDNERRALQAAAKAAAAEAAAA